MKAITFILIGLTAYAWSGSTRIYRPQKYAIFKAHTILPDSLKFIVKKNGKHLFAGLERGLAVASNAVDDARILRETRRITEMVDARRPFPEVVTQMGFVSGLLAVHTDPSKRGSAVARRGFHYYLNLKLNRFTFVFDGYEAGDPSSARVRRELAGIQQKLPQYLHLLEQRYAAVNGNDRYPFDERSAVFGVSSIYFSNLARLSALLWYDAWTAAHGDVTRMPFRRVQTARRAKP